MADGLPAKSAEATFCVTTTKIEVKTPTITLFKQYSRFSKDAISMEFNKIGSSYNNTVNSGVTDNLEKLIIRCISYWMGP